MRLRFAVAVWGEWHSRQLLNLCLPSLLSEGNMPGLARDFDCEFRFYTDDAERFRDRRAIRDLADYAEISYDIANETNQMRPFSAEHDIFTRATLEAKDPGLCLIKMAPDWIWGSGSMAKLGAILKAGFKAVMINGPRADEAMAERLSGFRSLDVTPEALVDLVREYDHPLTSYVDLDAGFMSAHPEMIVSRVGEEGYLCTNLSHEIAILFPGEIPVTHKRMLGIPLDERTYVCQSSHDDPFFVSVNKANHEPFQLGLPLSAEGVKNWWGRYQSPCNAELCKRHAVWHNGNYTENLWIARMMQHESFLEQVRAA